MTDFSNVDVLQHVEHGTHQHATGSSARPAGVGEAGTETDTPAPIYERLRSKMQAVPVVLRPATKSAFHKFNVDQTRTYEICKPDRFRKRATILPPVTAALLIGTQEACDAAVAAATVFTAVTGPPGLVLIPTTLTVPVLYESEEALWAVGASNVAVTTVDIIEETYAGGPSVD